jgi:hypothetical protein
VRWVVFLAMMMDLNWPSPYGFPGFPCEQGHAFLKWMYKVRNRFSRVEHTELKLIEGVQPVTLALLAPWATQRAKPSHILLVSTLWITSYHIPSLESGREECRCKRNLFNSMFLNSAALLMTLYINMNKLPRF